jgi:hypothetical protein
VLRDEHDISNIIAQCEHFAIILIATVTSPEDLEDDDEVMNIVIDEKESQTSARSEVLNRKRENANASVLNSFKSLCKCERIDELFECTLLFSATIESLDGKLASALLLQSQKTKILFGRWATQKISTAL